MKALTLASRGGSEAIVCADVPMPEPGAGEVLIRVHAAGVTPSELDWAPTWSTLDGAPRTFPIIPGHEFSGEVAALGAGVTEILVGLPVFGMNDWFNDGTQAEYCLARLEQLAPKPLSIDHGAAATVPISALTAHQGLHEHGRLARGERVLIHGAAGAVGAYAVQIARLIGATVIGTVSAHNLDLARELGCDEVIDYRATRFEDAVGNVDLVFDTVGGETLERSRNILNADGRIVSIAASVEHSHDERGKAGFFVVRADSRLLSEIATLIDEGLLQPMLDSIVPLAEARSVYERKSRHGKSALQVAPSLW